MRSNRYPSVSLHNVAELEPAEWAGGDSDRLCRVPAGVREGVNEDASNRLRHATDGEVRFVPETDDAEIEVTLSAAERTEVRIFWGGFQPWRAEELDSSPRTFTLSVPERVGELEGVDTGRFDPRVCRILFDRFVPVAIHDVAGDCRPPRIEEVPSMRYLAYGTSITEGAKASAPHLGYVSHVARECGVDAINLGCSGSAHCEPALAEYIADREDWDLATLALSVNMANDDYTVAEFRERVEYFVHTIADAHPEKPIACVTLFPYFADVTESGDLERAAAFREVLRDVVSSGDRRNLSLVEGPGLLSPAQLTWDILHPDDEGMRSIGVGLAAHLERVRD